MSISVVFLGQNHRLLRAVSGIADTVLAPDADLRNRRILFAAAVDEAGPCPAYYAFLRRLRREPDCLAGSTACVVVDGATELYTKAAAQELVLAANLAGCRFPGGTCERFVHSASSCLLLWPLFYRGRQSNAIPRTKGKTAGTGGLRLSINA